MPDILIVVGNATRARLFRVHGGVLERLEVLEQPEAPAPRHPQGRERPPTPDPGASSFARSVARRIAIQARRAHLPDLLLLAPPRFLGRLKAALEPAVAGRVVASVAQDYAAAEDAALIDILGTLGIPAALPSPA